MGDSSAGRGAVHVEELWLNRSLRTRGKNRVGWSCDTSPCAEKRVLLQWTKPARYLRPGIVQLLLM